LTDGAFGLKQDALAAAAATLVMMKWQIGILLPHLTVQTAAKPTNGANDMQQGQNVKCIS